MSRNVIYVLLLIQLAVSGCVNKSKDITVTSNDLDVNDVCETRADSIDFLIALDEDRATWSDSLRCIRVVESKIYKERSSIASDYVPLFNYLIEHHNEEFDEGISIDLYGMFSMLCPFMELLKLWQISWQNSRKIPTIKVCFKLRRLGSDGKLSLFLHKL